MQNKLFITVLSLLATASLLSADNNSTKEIQDMSDPLAVFTQAGIGFTDKGINIKIGKAYDSGKPATMAMNIIEVQGVLGDTLGFRDNQVNTVDSLRFRNFVINTKNGFGGQVDIAWDFNTKSGSASYAVIQALPAFSIIQLYPLAGVGLSVANNVNNHPLWAETASPSGLSVPGAYATVGMYSKITITKKIWLNYNPIYLYALTGSDAYVKNAYGEDQQGLFTHEVSLSYQIAPRFNVRYFGNWNETTDFVDGGQRIEFNYQL
ncbi:hypothetical protein JHD49_05350 [Sulfurimonas sp. SAG-AH-194-C21]|nr:hypothetical protein [Sulfurimonas sp. SAG-AH-194-C21]MDF1883362.1 hypothetical protein [Sulfurimonas sp. SAG-AH-194-C21]